MFWLNFGSNILSWLKLERTLFLIQRVLKINFQLLIFLTFYVVCMYFEQEAGLNKTLTLLINQPFLYLHTLKVDFFFFPVCDVLRVLRLNVFHWEYEKKNLPSKEDVVPTGQKSSHLNRPKQNNKGPWTNVSRFSFFYFKLGTSI